MTFYIVDGSEACFYTAVFDAYPDKDCIITGEKDVQMDFESDVREVATDPEKAERVRKKLYITDTGAVREIKMALRSCDALKEQTAFRYIKLIMATGAPVRRMMSNPVVMEMNDLTQKVSSEVHKMKGFLRFMENAQGVLYAPYSPDNDITDLLARHFIQRFSNQKFVIHDIKRKIAAMYDGEQAIMVDADGADVYLSEYERTFEELWRLYYKSVNIQSRPHEKQMKGYMPVRYWKFMPEKK